MQKPDLNESMVVRLSKDDQSTQGTISAVHTMELPIAEGKRQIARFRVPLLILAFILTFVAGGAIDHALKSARGVAVPGNQGGWLLTAVVVNGASAPTTTEEVYIAWDVNQNAHDLHAEWYVIDPASAKHPIIATFSIDALSNGQGGVTITATTPSGTFMLSGTLDGTTMQLVVPPNSHLYPPAPYSFVTLTFTPYSTDAFNQLIAGGA